jgi:acetyltransferase-like isoleucine patch superfamily enzyme
VIENDAILGSHISITNGSEQHGTERLDVPIRMQPGVWRRITIGRDSWIGERALVMADVGRHCVVGAGAVVTRSIPDYAIAVGVPARIIGYRNGAPGGVVACQNTD